MFKYINKCAKQYSDRNFGMCTVQCSNVVPLEFCNAGYVQNYQGVQSTSGITGAL